MRFTLLLLPALLLALVCAVPARVAEPARTDDDQLADQVRDAITAGINYLRKQEAGRGNLERADDAHGLQVGETSALFPGGRTALGTFALLTAGVPADDPLVQRCLKHLRDVPRDQTYVVALQTMVFAAAGEAQDKDRIQQNVDWLLRARHYMTNEKGQ